MSFLVSPGFFASQPVQTALILGGGAAIVSATTGVFTIIRGQSFAGHALADVSSAGGAGAYLIGANPILGFLGMALASAGMMELFGAARARERDLLTGIILGAGLGLTSLFLYFDIFARGTSGAAISVMFGSMFAIPEKTLPLAAGIGAGALAILATIYRPLLLTSLNPELAALTNIPVRPVGLAYLAVLSLSVTLAAMTIGAILSTALLIGPAAAALRLARRPGQAILFANLIALFSVWGGILLAYDSYNWTPGHSWPVSFFTVTLIFVAYLLTSLAPQSCTRGSA